MVYIFSVLVFFAFILQRFTISHVSLITIKIFRGCPANIHCWANIGQMQSSALARCRNQRWPNVDLHQCAVLDNVGKQHRANNGCCIGPALADQCYCIGPAWANCIGPTAVTALVRRWQINATALAQRGQINATALVKYWQTALQELTESLSAHYK